MCLRPYEVNDGIFFGLSVWSPIIRSWLNIVGKQQTLFVCKDLW